MSQPPKTFSPFSHSKNHKLLSPRPSFRQGLWFHHYKRKEVCVCLTLFTYDTDGQLNQKITSEGITTYSYNTQGTLTKVVTPTNTIEYILNPLGQRVAKKIDGTITEKYLWANLTTLLATLDANNNIIQRYNYTDSRVPTSMIQDGETYYLHYDQVGTLKAISDINHNIVKEITYDTYGNILNDSNPSFKIPFGFAGGLYDPHTNLVHFGYREYDPYTGKWTTKDPIDFNGGDSNLYGYVLGDPVNFIDPTGLIIWWLLTPTDIGPDDEIRIGKDKLKTLFNKKTGESRPYYKKKKLNCETRKDGFEASENAKKQDLNNFMKEHRIKNSNKKPLVDFIEFLWEMFK